MKNIRKEEKEKEKFTLFADLIPDLVIDFIFGL